jgi:type IV fimbrial biogenesis protein FimT
MYCNIHGLRHKSWRVSSRIAQSGYSLFDLIITSAVAGVLSLGAVGMTGLVQDARMTSTVNQLMGDLSLARSEAIKRNTIIVICKSDNGATCSADAAWDKGWIIFTDINNNHDVDANEAIIHVQQALSGSVTLRYGSLHDYMRYAPTSETWSGTFTFCDSRGANHAKAVIVYWTGRPRVSTKTSDGKPLNCT